MKITNASKPRALQIHKETLKVLTVKSGVRAGDVAPLPVSRTCPVITWKSTLG